MSGKAASQEAPAVAEVHESSTRPGKPKVSWYEGDPPGDYDPVCDGGWDITPDPPSSTGWLTGGTTDPAGANVFRLDLQPGFGLTGESGIRAGEIVLWIETPSTSDISFSLSQSGPGSVSFPATTMTIEAGNRLAFMAFTITSAGDVTITATRLDASGSPTSFALSGDVTGASVESLAVPRLYVSWPGRSLVTVGGTGGGVWRRVEAGTTPPPIVVRRSGFDDFATQATTVSLSVSDPSGVLDSMPSSVTIAAGEDRMTVPVPLTGSEGQATITFTYAGETHDLVVDAEDLDWSANVLRIEVPANARMIMIEARLNLPASAPRTVTFASQDSSVINVDAGWDSRTLYEGWTSVAAPLTANGVGSTTVTISSGALPVISVPVSVRAPEVEVSRTAVTLSNTAGDNGGVYLLRAPLGQVWATFSPALGTSGFMSVDGVGTPALTITFEEGVQRGMSTIVNPYSFSGTATGPSTVVVFDGVHSPQHQVSYIYEVFVD